MNQEQKEFWKKAGIGASKALLIGVALSGLAVVPPQAVAGILGLAAKAYEGIEERKFKKEQIKRSLRYLQSRKLIDIQKQYNQEVFSLTKLGYFRVRKLLKSFAIAKPKKWDGKWRMVVFDVPETKKDRRDVFRQQLKSLGLANLQQSIWIHPYECQDQVYYLAGNLFIKPYVRYIVAESVTGGKDLKRRFDLD